MLPIKMEITNFSSYKKEIINFDKWSNDSPNLILGDNGVGKSSIIDTITTTIFNRCHGVDARGNGMDELIHQGEDKFVLDYTFEMNNITYRIIRERSKGGKQKLQLFANNINQTLKLQETQNKINDIFKMDYDTFMDTIIIGQNESAGFMKKLPTERKKIIAQILQLDKYDILESYTKDSKKQIENDIKLLEIQINTLYDSIKNKDNYLLELQQLKLNFNKLDKDIKIKEKELENELIEKTQYEELKKQQDSIINRKNTINNTITNLNNEKIKYQELKIKIENVLSNKELTQNKIELLNKTIKELTEEEKELNLQKVKFETENSLLNNTINELKNKYIQLKKYNDCECKFCGQQITEKHKNNHLLELKNQGSESQKLYNQNINKIETIDNKLKEIKINLNQNNSQLNESTLYLTKIQQAEIKIENVNSQLININDRFDQLLKEKEEVDNIDLTILSNKTFNDNVLKIEIQKLRNNFTNINSRIGVLENELNNIDKNEIQYNENKVKYDNLKNEIEIYNDLQKAWSKNGIQAIIIDNILPQIESEINKYLKILSGDKISILFKTQKEAKNGNKSETLDVIVKDNKGSRPYERYSGGEKTRINFACHIGMSKFLTKRSGSTMDFFIVDEGIGTLDDAGKDDFLDTINSLNLIFKKVMIISHIPDIKEAFNNKILVTKDIYEGSKVTMLN